MNGKKILITGSDGMLGSNLTKLLPYKTVGFNSTELDVTDLKKCIQVLENEKPNVVIHAAAYTDVDGCELNPDKAYKINTVGTQNLVNCCIDKDVLFIYISSTGVYGEVKEKDPYTEFDEVHPTTIHHSSKYEAEKIVKNHLNRYLILRTGWLFGGEKTHSKNFVYKRYLEASNNNVIYSDDSQIGNPTYIKDLVRQIQILIESNQVGVFNCVNKAFSVSRYDYVKKIVSLLDLSCEVKKVSSDFFIRKAKVSKNESATNYKLELLNLNIMENWDSALNKYIAQIVRDLK